ncbi:MAG: GtrA family protein [Candidatus Kerfeldbacteria bacterium]|nr:GtrA family protein [Candidatus Kerfeldbacteria bacterium]
MMMRQALKFIVVGGISTVVNYTVFFLSYHYGQINYLVASAIGYVIGLSLSYLLNASWTFRQQSTPHLIGNQTVRFITIYVCSLVMSLGLIYLLVHWLGMDPRVANIIAISQTTITNFLGCKYYVFK